MYEPGISVLKEVARAAGVGIRIHTDNVPVFPETQPICNHYHLDPMGLIASGAFLIILPATEVEKIVTCLRSHGVTATNIGEVTDKGKESSSRPQTEFVTCPSTSKMSLQGSTQTDLRFALYLDYRIGKRLLAERRKAR